MRNLIGEAAESPAATAGPLETPAITLRFDTAARTPAFEKIVGQQAAFAQGGPPCQEIPGGGAVANLRFWRSR
jgi:hypothetical protein